MKASWIRAARQCVQLRSHESNMSMIKHLSRVLRQPFNARYAFRRLAGYHAKPRSLEEVVDWAMNFGGDGYMRVKTLQMPSEIMRLAHRLSRPQSRSSSSRSAPPAAAPASFGRISPVSGSSPVI